MYTKLECVGRGGSSKVYKVMAPNRKIFALKRIRLQVGRAWGVNSSCWLLLIQSAVERRLMRATSAGIRDQSGCLDLQQMQPARARAHLCALPTSKQGRDAEAATGFLDEIKLLNSLAGRSNIIQLIDSEASGAERACLVMAVHFLVGSEPNRWMACSRCTAGCQPSHQLDAHLLPHLLFARRCTAARV